MKPFILKYQARIVPASIVFACALSFALFRWKGLLGVSLGIGGAWLNLWFLWRLVDVLGNSTREKPIVKAGTWITVMGFLIKVPILILLGFAMSKLGGEALYCFVGGLGMVYFGLVGWAISRT